MNVNEQIDKVFGDINHNNKKKINSPDSFSKPIPNKKSFFKKHINHNNINNNENKSFDSIESIKEIKRSYLNNDEDNSFYIEFMKKIKEDEKENDINPKNINKKKLPHLQMKPGFLRKEKSQSNFQFKHFLEGKKERIHKNNTLKFEENKCGDDNSLINTNHKNKISKKYNFIDSNNPKNYRSIFNQTNLSHEKNLNQLTVYSKKGFNLEDEKVQNSIQFQILNKFRKFNELKVQTPISFDQIIKGINFSNVKKLNLNSQNDNINLNNINIINNSNNVNDNKNTDNANQNEVIYPSSNNVLKAKRNSIFCCF